MLRYFYNLFLVLFVSSVVAACTDSLVAEDAASDGEEFNIAEYSDGYSVAFDMTLDRLGDSGTRADTPDDAMLEEWENYLDPEEFRVLFFDSQDRFLFESRARWFTEIESESGGKRWRVAVPVFQYLSDKYDPNNSDKSDGLMSDAYNWERIAEIMRTDKFKIAILANRPSKINVEGLDLSDLSEAEIRIPHYGENGPFWGPENSVATYAYPENYESVIKKVFDLHHCQYDPFYENKNRSGGCYDFIMEYNQATLEEKDGSFETTVVPHMGAVSSWLNPKKKRMVGGSPYFFYRLPVYRVPDEIVDKDDFNNKVIKPTTPNPKDENDGDYGYKEQLSPQYIPMYGIQEFDALTTWKKGTTYNLSKQTGSQGGEYDYRHIVLLRSVVKLELRIPWYDNRGIAVNVDKKWVQIFGNNFMARCEPLDVSTPTEQIWNDNHMSDCEWKQIRNYGLYARGNRENDNNNYRKRLSWFYGFWDEKGWWKLNEHGGPNSEEIGSPVDPDNKPEYPRIFNPITQRLTCSLITDCYLPIEEKYHRWVVYCGEHNMTDANVLDNLSERGIASFFRVSINNDIYSLPIVNYGGNNNPIKDWMKGDNNNMVEKKDTEIKSLGYPENMNGKRDNKNGGGYFTKLQDLDAKTAIENDYYPYPLLRNHHYRLTVSFGAKSDVYIDTEVMDGEKRTVGDIVFN